MIKCPHSVKTPQALKRAPRLQERRCTPCKTTRSMCLKAHANMAPNSSGSTVTARPISSRTWRKPQAPRQKTCRKRTGWASHYISDIAESLSAFASSMRGKSAEEMLQQAGRLARENPALFVTGSVAVGFGLSRFLRASSSDLSASATDTSSHSAARPQYPAGERDGGFSAGTGEGSREGDALKAQHPYSGDAVRGAPIQTPDPLAPHDPTAHGSATTDLDDGVGIQQSGAELGSFNSDPGTASSPASAAPSSPISPAPDKPAPRGEF
jgi:hypothetical protein